MPGMRSVLACLLLAGGTVDTLAWEVQSEAGVEITEFAQAGAQEQGRHDVSLRLQARVGHEWNESRDHVQFVPFLRLDEQDAERSHADLREAFWSHAGEHLELRAGVRRVFWGVTEGVHLVDVINQTDLVENPDGEEKLGQPMLNLALENGSHSLDFFLLAGTRERRYPGRDGRFRLPWVVDDKLARWESAKESGRVDGAARWLWNDGPWWVALSGFSGTAREPVLEPLLDLSQLMPGPDGVVFAPGYEPVLRPFYPKMEQAGLELQFTTGDWLLKFEGIDRHGSGRPYQAWDAGLEYTQVGLAGTAVDLGWLFELLHDSRGESATTAFADDVLLGWRVAFNDAAASQLLLYAIVDRQTRERLVSLEGSYRLRDALTLSLQARSFGHVAPAQSAQEFFQQPDGHSSLRPFADDDYIRMEVTYFF